MSDLLSVPSMARNNNSFKGRSASISFSNTSAKIPDLSNNHYGNQRDSSVSQHEQKRHRKPAARSQSARNPSSSSLRKRFQNTVQINDSINLDRKCIYNSEPRFDNFEDSQSEQQQPQQQKQNNKIARRGASLHCRKSNAFLEVPDSAHYDDDIDDNDEDCYRMRSFSFTSKGIVNRGDSFRRRKSRSNSLLPLAQDTTSDNINNGNSNTNNQHINDLCGSSESDIENYQVLLLGSDGVGKTALIHQFMTTESINAYDTKKDSVEEQRISVMLNGEESQLTFTNASKSSMKTLEKIENADAFIILYSVIDKSSFLRAEAELAQLQDSDLLRTKPAILVANKIDLARSRAVSPQDGKCLACSYKVKFIEISVGINHNVDELLVGLLNQIRLKSKHIEFLTGRDNSRHWYKNRNVIRARMKARQMFTWIFGKEDSKFKNCENLHVL